MKLTQKRSKDNLRKHVRFPSEMNTVMYIGFQDKLENFERELVGLMLDESQGGCGFLIVREESFEIGSVVIVQFAKFPAVKGTVRWQKELDEGIFKIGIEYC